MGGVGLGGVRVDVNEELKFLGKFKKKKLDVNAMLGVGVMWGMGDVNQE